jgi:hypothetical protein
VIITDRGLVAQAPDGSALIILAEAIKCDCGRMALFVVNRMGKTRCLECDEKFKAK